MYRVGTMEEGRCEKGRESSYSKGISCTVLFVVLMTNECSDQRRS